MCPRRLCSVLMKTESSISFLWQGLVSLLCFWGAFLWGRGRSSLLPGRSRLLQTNATFSELRMKPLDLLPGEQSAGQSLSPTLRVQILLNCVPKSGPLNLMPAGGFCFHVAWTNSPTTSEYISSHTEAMSCLSLLAAESRNFLKKNKKNLPFNESASSWFLAFSTLLSFKKKIIIFCIGLG